jgi:anti-sigma regulatory factor (Ser/Thr protein kinase)
MSGTLVHEALLYRDPRDYLRGTVRFIEEGLHAGEPVLVAVPGGRLDLVRDAIDGTTCDGRSAGVRFVDMAKVGRNPGRIIPGVLHEFVEEHPGRRVRMVVEPVWPGRTPDEYPACVQHEALINLVFGDLPVTILCPYDTANLDPLVLSDAKRTHPWLLIGDDRCGSGDYASPEEMVDAYNQPLPDRDSTADVLVFEQAGLGRVRQFVASQAARANLSHDRVDDLQMAVNEVATNAVTHSQGPGALRVWHDPDRIVCEVTSPGELTDRLAGRIPPAFDSESGRGLVLVHHLCDLVQVHTHQTQTTIRLHLWR